MVVNYQRKNDLERCKKVKFRCRSGGRPHIGSTKIKGPRQISLKLNAERKEWGTVNHVKCYRGKEQRQKDN